MHKPQNVLPVSKPDSYFHYFKASINQIPLPQKFTYPFNYLPHELSKIAAKELQDAIQVQTEWSHNFGLDATINGPVNGKMFGVLVVENKHQELGYLAAYSGKLADSNGWSAFVPPVYDRFEENGFFKEEEKNITNINATIAALENAAEYQQLKIKVEFFS